MVFPKKMGATGPKSKMPKMPSMPKAKAPGIKTAAAKTGTMLGKGRKPAAPKVARPMRMPMAPQQPAPQPTPGQTWAGVMPGQAPGQ